MGFETGDRVGFWGRCKVLGWAVRVRVRFQDKGRGQVSGSSSGFGTWDEVRFGGQG